MGRLDTLASGLIQPMNPNGASLIGLLTFFWGLWVANPFWEVFNSGSVFSQALELAPEWAWGTWATLVGAAVMASVWNRNAKWLSRTSLWAAWHWSTVSGMMWWGDWHNTAGLVYMFVALYCLFVYLNIKVNYVKTGIRKF